jgi:HPt (histidine-containing phosphotransfer) domain-containing protein
LTGGILEPETCNELVAALGETTWAEMFDAFQGEVRDFADAAPQASAPRLERLAHSLTGAAASIGATDIAEACAALEVGCAESDPALVSLRVAALSACDRFEHAVRSLQRV